MKKKWGLIVVAITVMMVIALLPACAEPTAPAPQEPIEWHVQTTNVPNTLANKLLFEQMPRRIAQATGGRLRIVECPLLVKDAYIFDAIRDGRLEGGTVVTQFVAGGLCPANLLDLPVMFEDYKSMLEWQEATGCIDIIRSEMRRQFDLELLMYYGFGSQWVHSVTPIRTADDFKGLKIRVFGENTAKVVAHLGASPLNIPFGEVYLALQTGIIDGVHTGIVSAYGSGFHEIATYTHHWEVGGTANNYYYVSSKAWNALPDDLKPVVKEVFQKLEQEWREGILPDEESLLAKMEAEGVGVIYPAPGELAKMIPAAREIVTEWRQQCEEVGFKIPEAWEEHIKARGLWAD